MLGRVVWYDAELKPKPSSAVHFCKHWRGHTDGRYPDTMHELLLAAEWEGWPGWHGRLSGYCVDIQTFIKVCGAYYT